MDVSDTSEDFRGVQRLCPNTEQLLNNVIENTEHFIMIASDGQILMMDDEMPNILLGGMCNLISDIVSSWINSNCILFSMDPLNYLPVPIDGSIALESMLQ